MQRRTYLKAVGGIAGAATAGGVGLAAFGENAAALSTNFSASDVTIENDAGHVSEVFIEPDFVVEWENFDEPVGKVRVLVEAAVNGESYDAGMPGGPYNYTPVFRATPWINGDAAEDGSGPTSTGSYDHRDEVDHPWHITLFEDDYTRPAYNVTGDTSAESHWDGTSVGSNASAYVNGMYGAVGDSDQVESMIDGETNATKVHLRYTVSLHTSDTLSPLVMYDESQYGTPFQDVNGDDVPANAIPHYVLHENTQHPAINVATTSFDVVSINQAADQGLSGTSQTGASGNSTVEGSF